MVVVDSLLDLKWKHLKIHLMLFPSDMFSHDSLHFACFAAALYSATLVSNSLPVSPMYTDGQVDFFPDGFGS